MLLYGTIGIDVYDPKLKRMGSAIELWQALASRGVLPLLIGIADRSEVPDRFLPEAGVWHGRGKTGTFYLTHVTRDLSGIKAEIAFRHNDENWTPTTKGNCVETDLIPNLTRLQRGVRFILSRSYAFINLRLRE